MSETVTLAGLTFAVTRSPRRRRLRVTVGPDRALEVAAPLDCPDEHLEAFLREKLPWVQARLAARPPRPGPRPVRYVAGAGFGYLGRSYRLLLADDAEMPAGAGPLCLHRGRFLLRRAEADGAAGHFRAWCTARARPWLQGRLALWAPRAGVLPADVEVGELGGAWARAATDGRIQCHWGIITLAPAVADFVLVGELVRLREPRRDWWAAVERLLPDAADLQRRLAACIPPGA